MAEGLQTKPLTNPIHQLAVNKFGRGSYLRGTSGTIGTTIDTPIRSNPNRLSFTFINNSASIIYLHPTPDVSATVGIPIAANGGGLSMDFDSDGEAVTQAWFGLGAAAALAYSLIETTIEGG